MHFVGAGPGDPELLTLKARRAAARGGCGDPRPAGAEGDPRTRPARGGDRRGRQDGLRRVLEAGRHQRADRRERGARARSVVRLKGGDPVVFGRLDEEIEAVRGGRDRLGIVPGVTSASRAPRRSASRLTKRGRNSVVPRPDRARRGRRRRARLARARAARRDGGDLHGRRRATFLRGRLLMHGARADRR